MGIEDFVPKFLKTYFPEAQLGPARGGPAAHPVRPGCDILIIEVAPLLHQLSASAAGRKKKQAAARSDADEKLDPDDEPLLAFSNADAQAALDLETCGNMTMLAVMAAIEKRVVSHIDGASDGRPKTLIIVGDTRGNLPIKASTRAARASSWLSGQKRQFPATSGASADDAAPFRYPPGCTLCDEGITLPNGKTVLVDVERLLHSGDNTSKQLATYMHGYFVGFRGSCFNERAYVLVDLGNDLQIAQIIGRDVPLSSVIIQSKTTMAGLRENKEKEAAGDEPAVVTCYLEAPDANDPILCHRPLEGDLAVVKYAQAVSWLPGFESQTIVIDTVDTDPVGILLSSGYEHFLWLRRVIWFSTTSGIWDLNKIEKKLLDMNLDNRSLMTAFQLCGSDFVKKKWFTHRIGHGQIWEAITHAARASNVPEQWTAFEAGYLDVLTFMLRAIYAAKHGLSNEDRVPTWAEISHAAESKRKEPKKAKKSDVVLASASASSASSSSSDSAPQSFELVPADLLGCSQALFIKRAIAVARAVNYWDRCGRSMQPNDEVKEGIDKYAGKYTKGVQFDPDDFGASDDEEEDDDGEEPAARKRQKV